ncbi:MAG TPA: CPBP family intramembrane glutamic endopeptidase [Verrucomicrobiales bacterium]|nr:CPBP family intramembrane glutamic endopeptidase [Verrucomicrobiales bacterium]
MTAPSAPPPVQVSPPDLPVRRDAVRRRLCWILILLACGWIVFNGMVERAHPEASDRSSTTILSLQCRVLLSAAATQPEAALEQFRTLEKSVTGPSGARALACVYAFLSSDEARASAHNLLNEHPPEAGDEDGIALHTVVRQAIDEPASLESADRETLQEDLGWFGEVLLAASLEPEDPARQVFYQNSSILTVIFVTAFLVALLAGIAGLTLLIVALVQRRSGRFTTHFQPGTTADTVYLEAFTVYLTLVCVAQVLVYSLTSGAEPSLEAGLAAMLLPCLLGVFWPVIRGRGLRDSLRGLGFHRGQGVFREIGCGLVGYLSVLPLVVLGLLLVLLLSSLRQGALWIIGQFREDAPTPTEVTMSHPVIEWIADGNILTVLQVYFLAAVFAPLFEELLFRGALFRGLRSRHRVLAAGLLTGFVFAVIHPQGLLAVPMLMALGFGFGLLREWRDSLIAPMTGHALHNAALVTLMWIAFSS